MGNLDGRSTHNHRSATEAPTMLVLSRKINERILIGDSIVLTIVQVQGSTVRIGIEAPPEVAIVREELLRKLAADDDGRALAVAR
jgi:carbon storage regulator CsrA